MSLNSQDNQTDEKTTILLTNNFRQAKQSFEDKKSLGRQKKKEKVNEGEVSEEKRG